MSGWIPGLEKSARQATSQVDGFQGWIQLNVEWAHRPSAKGGLKVPFQAALEGGFKSQTLQSEGR